MSLKRKMLGNGVASAGSIAWTALIQLLSVPVLTAVWGLDRYGQWLMLSTIPTYFALSDLGFATAATSDMTMANARGERDAVRATFQSVWLLLVLISGTALLLLSPLSWWGLVWSQPPLSWWPAESLALFWMIAYSAAALCSRVVLAGLRSTGHYAIGTILYDALQFLEGLAILVIAYRGGSFADCAFAYLLVRLGNMFACYALLRHQVPWLALGVKAARRAELKRLLGPALGAMAIPGALAINIQGMILVAGTLVSPAAAAVLGPVRTISRIAIQVVGIVSRATMPEFSAAVARGDKAVMGKLVRLNLLSVLGLLIPGTILFIVFGRALIHAWSGGRVSPEAGLVVLMAAATAVQGLWLSASNLLMAVNQHAGFSRMLMISAAFSIALAIPLGHLWGLDGIAASILAGECIALSGIVFVIHARRSGVA